MALARKWCEACEVGGTIRHSCTKIDAAIREALEEAEKLSIAARDLDGPHEGRQIRCDCELGIVTHLKAWNRACEHIAAAIATLREGH